MPFSQAIPVVIVGGSLTQISNAGGSVVIDGSGNTTITGNLTVTGTITPTGVLVSPHFTSPVVDSGGLTITAGGLTVTAGNITASAGNSNLTLGTGSVTAGNLILSGKATTYNGLTTAGTGLPVIVSYARSGTQTNTTVTIINAFSVPGSDTSYEISGNVNITAQTSVALSITATYTDVNNQSRARILPLASIAGAYGVSVATTGDFATAVMSIRCKASTTITIATTGTVTGVTYTAEAMIKEVT
jgi:hypothetical protein